MNHDGLRAGPWVRSWMDDRNAISVFRKGPTGMSSIRIIRVNVGSKSVVELHSLDTRFKAEFLPPGCS